MPRDTEKVVFVRMPEELHRKLMERAELEQRSAAAHVRWLVERDLKEKSPA